MKLKKLFPCIIILLCLNSFGIHEISAENSDSNNKYRNPIINESAPDPTVIRAKDGYFYLYGTEDTRNTPIYQSKDLVHWEFVGTAFTDATRPQWKDFKNGNLWAPEIRYFNKKYVLYYSYAVWGNEHDTGVGVATSDSPKGPFTDQGRILNTEMTGVRNCIDQFFYQQGKKKYLFWGSFHGIYAVELTKDGLAMKTDKNGNINKRLIAGGPEPCAYEGVNIYKKGKYYYLFASTGSCCEGSRSTYQTVVGRSKNLFGPYLDKQGRPMTSNHHEVIIKGNEKWAGPGHNSIIIKDDAGQEWIIYHGYKKEEADKGRVILMDRLQWSEDGWPYINEENAPSIESEVPFIKK